MLVEHWEGRYEKMHATWRFVLFQLIPVFQFFVKKEKMWSVGPGGTKKRF